MTIVENFPISHNSAQVGTAKITAPDQVIFAYNPAYIDIEVNLTNFSGDTGDVIVQVIGTHTYEIRAKMYNNRIRVYVSRILQLMFDNPIATRDTYASIEMWFEKMEGGVLYSRQHIVIWGSIQPGERFNSFGTFHHDAKKPYMERTRIWFKNFPFTVSMFASRENEGLNVVWRFDGGLYGEPVNVTEGISERNPKEDFPNAVRTATYRQNGKAGASMVSVFDHTFDYTFLSPRANNVITNLLINNRTQGVYLRWIDNFGFIQYYLFYDGNVSNKNNLSTNDKVVDAPIGGMYFPNITRTTSVESVKTCKCCAVSMEQNIYDYVQTIVSSPVIDLYLGKTIDNVEIWCPVNIVASNHDYNPNDVLHDLEISFTMPAYNSQSL